MATAQDLLDLLDDKLLPYKNSFGASGPNSKIRALSSGQHKVWALIVAAGRQARTNWFGKKTTLAFTTGLTELALPTDFHDILWAESTAVRMKASSAHKETWQEERKKTGNLDMAGQSGAIYYIVSGDYQPKLLISRPPDASGLSVTVHYTSTLLNLTTAGDNIDRLPVPYRDAVVNYAVSELVAATIDRDSAEYWRGLWNEDKQLIREATSIRQSGDTVDAEGHDLQE